MLVGHDIVVAHYFLDFDFAVAFAFFVESPPFLINISTSIQSFCPRVQTTVASSTSPSVSGMRHFISSGLGQGQSIGLATQSSVSGHR